MTALKTQIALDDINKEHWYNWQQPACPLLLGGCFEACGERFRDTFKIPFFTSILYFRPLQGGGDATLQGSWLLRLEEGVNCGTYLVDLLQLESFRRRLSSEFGAVSNSLTSLADEIRNDRHSLPSDLGELGRLAEQFFSIFRRFYTLGAITEPVQWRIESVIKKDLIGSKAGFAPGATSQTWDGTKIMSAALATEAEPYALEILDDFGGITTAAERLLSQQNLDVSEDAKLASKFLNESQSFLRMMDEHVTKYSWKQSNYLRGLEYGRAECLEEVLRALQAAKEGNAKDPQSQASEAHRTRELLLADRADLLSSISDYHRRLMLLGDEFGSGMADRRKRTMLQALAALEMLAQKMAAAATLDRSDIVMLMPEEVAPFCKQPERFKDRLKKRREGFLLIESPFPILSNEFNSMVDALGSDGSASVPPRHGPTYVETSQITNVFEELNADLRITYARDGEATLSGDVAFADSHRSMVGRARIVRDPIVDEFEAGEILIATSTTPDFMPQIRLAKAIVTDQGGMATHAALTSRELKIPCIVGTAVGTLKIKTGDMVELDLQTGHIKIVSQYDPEA